jgi:tRNA modification GTPase
VSAELETIVAPATPVGRSALAIVRIDGPRSGEILSRLTHRVLPDARNATLTHIYNDVDQEIDECVAIRYVAPHSFTGNDLVELMLHGNPVLVSRTIETVVRLGARIAEAGEFTERAVLNGKLDLVQAESIADLIAARTPIQAKLSLQQLEGALSRKASAVRGWLLDVIARLEAALDFADEGYEFIHRDEALEVLDRAISDVRAVAETFRRGRATIEGLSAVILGRPNAGKSTLLNRLVGSDRAIVTPIPGTTRDILRETIEIGGLPVTLADTAGLREGGDVVEEIGIERARDAARRADIVLYLVDASRGLSDDDRREIDAITAERMVVYTKIDLARAPHEQMGVSAISDEGFDALLARLDAIVRDRFAAPEESPTIVNERQRSAVAECEDGLVKAREALAAGVEEQMVLVDLHRAANALGMLTGAITREDVLSEIFAKFCIGK